jgi:hypothetical protein
MAAISKTLIDLIDEAKRGLRAVFLVELDAVQTLTNKTLTAPVITSPTISGAVSTGSLGTDTAEIVIATNVIAAAESGSVFFLNATAEFVSTLPAPALGLRYTFVVTGAPSGASYTVIAAGGATIIKGHVVTSQDAGGSGQSSTTGVLTLTFVDGVSVVGDRADFVCDGTNWFVSASAKSFAAITLS